ncbi:MAG: GAF domain-containing protein [Candidatus Viridilinea halotolerans]|uniref:histidine kinase n=1 Tax=Candidatus Viridilinea halotolerans TaxID=2491704 RepID=A0A426TVK5_9CHLR|nr:MAG: GAF domain-containing protein [Candidatus Viridilinea halotolerans]
MDAFFLGCYNAQHCLTTFIQTHGALLVLRESDLTIVQVSANALPLLGIPPEQLLGQPLTLLFGAQQVAQLRTALTDVSPQVRPLVSLTLDTPHAPRPLLGRLLRQPGVVWLELEPVAATERWPVLVAIVRSLRTLRTLAGLWPVVAAQVSQLTGFDRVVIMQVQPDATCAVLAEQVQHGLSTRMHCSPTATSIPPALLAHAINPQVVVLADAAAEPVALLPTEPLAADAALIFAQLTLVAPSQSQRTLLLQHGLRATFSVPLFQHERLWGMICCQHYSGPCVGTFTLRTMGELLSEFLSLRISTLAQQPEALAAQLTQQQSAMRLGWLQSITAALGAALSVRAVASVVVNLATVALDASHGVLLLRAADGLHLEELPPLSRGAPERVSTTFTCPLTAYLPITEALRSGRALFLSSAEMDEPRFRDLPRLCHDRPKGACVALPLGDGALGGIVFGFRQQQSFSPAEQEFLLTLADLTLQALYRVRLYEDLQSTRAQAEAALRMRDQFLSVASHELKSPIAVLLGHAQLLERRLRAAQGSDASLVATLQQITQQTQRLDRMLNELLDISRIEQGQLRISVAPLDLSALLARVVNVMQVDLTRHTIHTSGLTQPRLILGDELRLVQIFENIINNAVKYSPLGGSVQISMEDDGSRVWVTISDQGIGIPAADLPNLFQCFYRAGNSGRWRIPGTGIGLYVVAELIRCHGGTIRVVSSEGEGSSFVVELPLA